MTHPSTFNPPTPPTHEPSPPQKHKRNSQRIKAQKNTEAKYLLQIQADERQKRADAQRKEMEEGFEERWKDEAEDRVKAARAEKKAWIEDKEDKPDIHGKSDLNLENFKGAHHLMDSTQMVKM